MTKPQDGKSAFVLWMDDDLREQFRFVCAARGVTASHVLRNAIRVFVRASSLPRAPFSEVEAVSRDA